jgi:hypothetical protein
MCRALLGSGCALAAIALGLLAPAAGAEARTVHIRGTAYEFNNTGVRLSGARIRVAEHPRLGATRGATAPTTSRFPTLRR